MQHNGKVLSEFEPPETLYVKYVGSVDGATIRAARAEAKTLLMRPPYHFIIFDVGELSSVSADARLAIVEPAAPGTSPLRGIAVIGATFHWRTIGMLMMRAAELLRTMADCPLRFFDTATQARDWLAIRRQQLIRQTKTPPEDDSHGE